MIIIIIIIFTSVSISVITIIQEKQIKVIWAIRNPKDVAVSFYYHHKGVREHNYNGKFENYLPLFLKGQCKLFCFFKVH